MLDIRKDFAQTPQPFNTGMQNSPTIEDQKPSPRFEGLVNKPPAIDSEVLFRSMTSLQVDDSFQLIQ